MSLWASLVLGMLRSSRSPSPSLALAPLACSEVRFYLLLNNKIIYIIINYQWDLARWGRLAALFRSNICLTPHSFLHFFSWSFLPSLPFLFQSITSYINAFIFLMWLRGYLKDLVLSGPLWPATTLSIIFSHLPFFRQPPRLSHLSSPSLVAAPRYPHTNSLDFSDKGGARLLGPLSKPS